jgi:hypothetical protein
VRSIGLVRTGGVGPSLHVIGHEEAQIIFFACTDGRGKFTNRGKTRRRNHAL